MTNNAQSMILGRLQQLNAALAANAASLPNLEGQRQQFDDMVSAILEALTRQDALTAEKQESSKILKSLLTETLPARHDSTPGGEGPLRHSFREAGRVRTEAVPGPPARRAGDGAEAGSRSGPGESRSDDRVTFSD
ncbi:MAG TPA: hypothetical protein VHU81_00265 [Thermoanaerobaculia bacterium]|nr:hypothetical protein [Thermoanaerobaculia bacterium]